MMFLIMERYKFGPVFWPARSPDYNPFDFYLWYRLEELIYAAEIHRLLRSRNERDLGIPPFGIRI